MSFNVGDRVRIKGTEPVGIVFQSAYDRQVKLVRTRNEVFHLESMEQAGFAFELVEPAIPEEPESGSVIRFSDDVACLRIGEYWRVVDGNVRSTWAEVMQDFGHDFVVLRSEREFAAEVADWVNSFEHSSAEPWANEIRKRYGVES